MNDLVVYHEKELTVLEFVTEIQQTVNGITDAKEISQDADKLESLTSYFKMKLNDGEATFKQVYPVATEYVMYRRRLGQLIPEMQERGELARAKDGRPKKVSVKPILKLSDFGVSGDQSSLYQKLATVSDEKCAELFLELYNKSDLPTLASLLKLATKIRKDARIQKSIEDLKNKVQQPDKYPPLISLSKAIDFLDKQESYDLLLTDPPYATDVENIYEFAKWLPVALSKLKSTGRAYIFIGAYPEELHAYLNQVMPHQILVWTYRNTIGPDRAREYKSNWQAILYYLGEDATDLNGDMLKEKFSVLDFNAPDGRLDGRFHPWEKPLDLARHLILQSTNEGDIIVDPFAGTGTFLLAGSSLGRNATGCDINSSQIEIAVQRGCICVE